MLFLHARLSLRFESDGSWAAPHLGPQIVRLRITRDALYTPTLVEALPATSQPSTPPSMRPHTRRTHHTTTPTKTLSERVAW